MTVSFEKALLVVVVFVAAMTAIFSSGEEALLIDSLIYLITGVIVVLLSNFLSKKVGKYKNAIGTKFGVCVLMWIGLMLLLDRVVALFL